MIPRFPLFSLVLMCLLAVSSVSFSSEVDKKSLQHPARQAYFGDLHIHTSYSNDAYTMGVRAKPDDSYIFAKGGSIEHGFGYPVQLSRPLDFAAVTDHAEYLGQFRAEDKNGTALSNSFRETISSGSRFAITWAYIKALASFGISGWGSGEHRGPVQREAWKEIIAAADRHYKPGSFTTFIAYEWSPIIDNSSLHRNVVYRSNKVPDLPYSSVESLNAEDLWQALEKQSEQGMLAISIPHNGNMSDGRMWEPHTFAGDQLTSVYAERRSRLEPIAEIIQIKGQSETHPLLSSTDEFANFALNDVRFGGQPSQPKGSYARDALRTGIEFAHREGFNPFYFGFIGSTDSHNASSPVEENSYHGKQPIIDGTPGIRLNQSLLIPDKFNMARTWGSGGLAAIWAEGNTRESLFDAMRRRETYATSGPRITLRFFGGWQYDEQLLSAQDPAAEAYRLGVPMGDELPPKPNNDLSPTFVLWALKDPNGANLDRLQVVKAWIDSKGNSHEKIYDVIAANMSKRALQKGSLDSVGNTVDVKSASYRNTIGDGQLAVVWRDPDFSADTHAFYYARVLEIPTPRWSTYDAKSLKVPAPQPTSIQERAISSAIWYKP